MNYFLGDPLSLPGSLSTAGLESGKTKWMVALTDGFELCCHRHLCPLAQQRLGLLDLVGEALVLGRV